MLEWITDPTLWAGLVTLILLELVLGIDNLVFVAILVDKVEPQKRDRARVIGILLALVMRIALLGCLSWLMGLSEPLFTLFGTGFSIRNLVLLAGGFFLIYKATSELHEHISPASHNSTSSSSHSALWVVITQIVVLDAVFSIDSVITAVGMVNHMGVMVAAVIIAVLLMLIASKPLTLFINRNPTIVMLCLGFLLMIGFSLVCEGLKFEIPKGYLYGAIVFSILIELLQELRRRGQKNLSAYGSRRARTTAAVMRMIGGSTLEFQSPDGQENKGKDRTSDSSPSEEQIFQENERRMVQGVLSLADKPIEAIITLRRELETIDVTAPIEAQLNAVVNSQHSWLVVIEDGHSDEPLGVINKKRLLDPLLKGQRPSNLRSWIEQPLVLLENVSVVNAVEHFRNSGKNFAFVVDEFGTLNGIATTTDILEEIAGKLPDPGETEIPVVTQVSTHVFDVDASEDVHDLNNQLPCPLPTGKDYTTLAGLVLDRLESLPYVGVSLNVEGWKLEVSEIERHRIKRVRMTREEHQGE